MYINRCRLESANCFNCEFYKQCFSGCLLYNLILPLENFSEVNLYVLDLYLFIFFLSHVNIWEIFVAVHNFSRLPTSYMHKGHTTSMSVLWGRTFNDSNIFLGCLRCQYQSCYFWLLFKKRSSVSGHVLRLINVWIITGLKCLASGKGRPVIEGN